MTTAASSSDQEGLQTLLARVRDFPTLPVTVERIIELVALPETTARDIESVMQADQVLTAKLLRLVNSPFYGFPSQVTTISRAVGVIGFEALRNLAFSSSIVGLFSAESSATFHPVEFWKHSIGTALAAKELSRRMGEKDIEEFFVGGLVHDIGKMVHHEYLREDFAHAGERALAAGGLLRDAEREVLRCTHDATAALLLNHWKLPRRLVAMAAHHHEPSAAREFAREASVVHLADILCRAKGLGSGGDASIPRLDPQAWERLGLTFADVERVMRKTQQDFDSATSLLTTQESDARPQTAARSGR